MCYTFVYPYRDLFCICFVFFRMAFSFGNNAAGGAKPAGGGFSFGTASTNPTTQAGGGGESTHFLSRF